MPLCVEQTFSDERLPETDVVFVVHVQYDNSCSSDISAAHDRGALPREMVVPRVPPWIEERGYSTRSRIDAGQVRPFVTVALEAR